MWWQRTASWRRRWAVGGSPPGCTVHHSNTVSASTHHAMVLLPRLLPLQKQELVSAFRKAGRLIDVLRRQKVHLEAAALLRVTSRELAEALQQGQAAGGAARGVAAGR